MRNEVLSSVGAQNMDTSGYQLSDLEDIEFHWENPSMNLAAVFQPGLYAPFSASSFNDFEMGSLTENPILADEMQDREKSHPLPTTLVSRRPTQTPVLMKCLPFGTRLENVS